ncbi:hypothetical protein [Paenibacillus yonginensis]|uniref:hypothetical protein n=1 Tax=Paenibacillus yonginensis TaxID=1462996 RepID=UPI00147154E7|nr:hypothetical protein [Paenibacillus yonginensis]
MEWSYQAAITEQPNAATDKQAKQQNPYTIRRWLEAPIANFQNSILRQTDRNTGSEPHWIP